MSGSYEMTAAQARTGIELSRRNARRLGSDALVLLAHGASAASVYGQWHLAVEELGKSSILSEALSRTAAGRSVDVPVRIFQGAHKEKFRAGFGSLPNTQTSGLGFALEIDQNTTATTETFADPYGGKGAVLIPSFTTGWFEDRTVGFGIQPSHELRLRLLYVDFDGTDWWEPEAELRSVEIFAKKSISRVDLHAAIEELLSVLS